MKFVDVTTGSPPPMRGKGGEAPAVPFVFGITPAYAGKSPSPASTSTPCGDHPRLCGEKLWRVLTILREKGSPPPMRGKGPYAAAGRFGLGITPAYAGKRGFFR